ncbi:MAG: hypothetical protein K0S56_261 [Microvirga sp.]|jgi:hypothetical protein|nr:hypothetical protein [Microvirga sp.]
MSGQIIDRVDLPDDGGSIVLYDWVSDDSKDGRNLVRVDPEGRTLWEATPPTTGAQDCFTRVQWDGQTLTANTWSGYLVEVDIKNGGVAALDFTK